jgi:putative transposase
MIKNHKLAKAISDVSWNEFRRQIDYKSKIYDNMLIIADNYYPSSKTCSRCGCVNHDLTLSDRTFTCKSCDLIIDRDYNASLNLNTLGLRGINDCGHLPTSSLGIRQNHVECQKQEINKVIKVETLLYTNYKAGIYV